MTALPDNPTGADLVDALRAHAAASGQTPTAIFRKLSDQPHRWASHIAGTRTPRPHTVQRVRAVLADNEVPPAPQNALSPLQEKVLAAITDAAEQDRACPSNQLMANRFHMSRIAIVNAVARLEDLKLIRVERFGSARRVTITATGRATRHVGTEAPHFTRRQPAGA